MGRKLFLTFFYTGLSPVAPGTVGTLAGAAAAFLILSYFPQSTLFLLTILLSIIAVKEINKYEEETKTHDSSQIVIDEVAGIWLAFSLSSSTYAQMILSILFFRIFDIWKPSIIGRVDEKVPGGLGVMGDDLLAGVFAGLCSAMVWQSIRVFFS